MTFDPSPWQVTILIAPSACHAPAPTVDCAGASTPTDCAGAPPPAASAGNASVDSYQGELISWFFGRFQIAGKIPYEKPKALRASATVSFDRDRKVTDFAIVRQSGDQVFDQEVVATLSLMRAENARLPEPPPSQRGLLRSPLPVSFAC